METLTDLETGNKNREMELISEAKEGRKSAFDELFQLHKSFIYNVCRRMIGSREDAIDATQAAFIQAYRKLGDFRGESSFRSWVCRIAINEATAIVRKESRRKRLTEKIELPKEHKHENDRVEVAMLALPPDSRAIMILFYYEELSCEEISEALGITPGAVRTRLHRARVLFRKSYEVAGK